MSELDAVGRSYQRTIWAIALAILVFAAGQAAWALSIGARQFLKDALDWGYDVALYGVAALVFGRGRTGERLSALAIAAILAVAGLHTLYDLWDKIERPRPIEVALLGFSAASAALIGYAVAGALLRFRRVDNPLIKATWISARNDAVATTGFAAAAFAVRVAPTRWPEYALDILGAALAFQGAAAILLATRRDMRRDRDARADEGAAMAARTGS